MEYVLRLPIVECVKAAYYDYRMANLVANEVDAVRAGRVNDC